MNDASTYWLTFTNIALGIVTLICFAAVVIGVLQEVAARRKRAEAKSKLDQDVTELLASFDAHILHVPGLGVTMADGGEELRKKEQR